MSALEWSDIASAPKDGTHILACAARQSFGGTPPQTMQTVVHWWGNPGEEGFYTSVNEMEPQHPFPATHWKPLDAPPRWICNKCWRSDIATSAEDAARQHDALVPRCDYLPAWNWAPSLLPREQETA